MDGWMDGCKPVCTCARTHVVTYVCVYVCMYACVLEYARTYVCMYVCMYLCVYVCVCMCTYVYACMYVCMYMIAFVCVQIAVVSWPPRQTSQCIDEQRFPEPEASPARGAQDHRSWQPEICPQNSELPKALITGRWPKSHKESQNHIRYIPELRTFGSSG